MNNIPDYSYLGVEGLDGHRLVKVTNMSRSVVAYTLPELNNLRKEFRPNISGRTPDSKMITFHELFTLFNSPGGEQIVWDALLIDDDEVRGALGLPTSEEVPELKYTREDVLNILKEGSDDEVLDMMEFGGFYIVEWVKEEIKNVDSRTRREFIGHLLHLNVDQMEENLKWAAEDPRANEFRYNEISGVTVPDGAGSKTGRRARPGSITNNEESVSRFNRRAPQ